MIETNLNALRLAQSYLNRVVIAGGVPNLYSDSNIAMHAVHGGLTGVQALALYNAIDALQTALSRAA